MKYLDYEWEIKKDRIILDNEINIDKLGWKSGDHFELSNVNGQVQLIKVEQVVKFLKGYK